MADFSTWSRENLVKFCFDATEELARQKDEITFLEQDLKAAMEAYREINRKKVVDSDISQV